MGGSRMPAGLRWRPKRSVSFRVTAVGILAGAALVTGCGSQRSPASPRPGATTDTGRAGAALGGPAVLQPGAPSAAVLERARGEDENEEFEHATSGQPADPDDTPAPRRDQPVRAAVPAASAARSAAAESFVIFRNTQASSGGSSTAEPTAANDGAAILTTANWSAAVSADSGLTWLQLNPFANPISGGFCCDQVAYPVVRGGHSLVLWLLQYKYLASDKQNAWGLRLFSNTTALQDNAPSCQWEFKPQQNFGLQPGYWLDYPRVSSTDGNVFVTTNVKDFFITKGETRVGALIVRFPIEDLDDGDCHLSYRSWFEKGDRYIAPVQNAGRTMFLGRLVQKAVVGDELKIFSIADGSNALTHVTRDIENFASRDKTRLCPGPDGTNPCARLHPDQATGFRSGNTFGWLWTAPQDGEFPFPQVRVAVFDTASLKKVAQYQIHNDGYAWTLPAVGVNARGELGVILYAMGGGSFPFPSAQAFIRKDPRDWSGITMHKIVSSTGGASTWGDYASVRPYGNCPNTFLGTAWSMQSGQAQVRTVWFGDPADGCADLTVSALLVLPVRVPVGSTMSLLQTTRNIGSGSAGPSSTRYYLSRDTERSADDVRLSPISAVPTLVRDGLVTGAAVTATIPASASGTYYPLSCADDLSAVAEVTDSNNCFAGPQVVEVSTPAVSAVAPTSTAALAPGKTLKVKLSVDLDSSTAPVTVSYYLSPSPTLGTGTISLGSKVVSPTASSPTHNLQLPATIPAGPLHLAACIGKTAVLAKCLLARTRLY